MDQKRDSVHIPEYSDVRPYSWEPIESKDVARYLMPEIAKSNIEAIRAGVVMRGSSKSLTTPSGVFRARMLKVAFSNRDYSVPKYWILQLPDWATFVNNTAMRHLPVAARDAYWTVVKAGIEESGRHLFVKPHSLKAGDPLPYVPFLESRHYQGSVHNSEETVRCMRIFFFEMLNDAALASPSEHMMMCARMACANAWRHPAFHYENGNSVMWNAIAREGERRAFEQPRVVFGADVSVAVSVDRRSSIKRKAEADEVAILPDCDSMPPLDPPESKYGPITNAPVAVDIAIDGDTPSELQAYDAFDRLFGHAFAVKPKTVATKKKPRLFPVRPRSIIPVEEVDEIEDFTPPLVHFSADAVTVPYEPRQSKRCDDEPLGPDDCVDCGKGAFSQCQC